MKFIASFQLLTLNEFFVKYGHFRANMVILEQSCMFSLLNLNEALLKICIIKKKIKWKLKIVLYVHICEYIHLKSLHYIEFLKFIQEKFDNVKNFTILQKVYSETKKNPEESVTWHWHLSKFTLSFFTREK